MSQTELVQSTATTIQLGPFLDATDGVTAETGLTPGIEISKGGAAFATANDGTATHDAEGWYRIDLDATDTNTLGSLVVKAQDSANHLPVWREFTVVPEQRREHVTNRSCGIVLKSSSTTVVVGPFISVSTGLPLTSLTVGNITCVLTKYPSTAGTLTLTASGGSNDMAHLSNGLWSLELTSTDTNTAGNATLLLRDDDVFVPVVCDLIVMSASHYDSYVTGAPLSADVKKWNSDDVASPNVSGYPQVDVQYIDGIADSGPSLGAAIDTTNDRIDCNVTGISGDTTAADNLEAACDGSGYNVGAGSIEVDVQKLDGSAADATLLAKAVNAVVAGQAVTGTLTVTQFSTNLSEATDDHYNGRTVTFTSGALDGESREITDYNGTTKVITVATMTDAPSNGDTFTIQ